MTQVFEPGELDFTKGILQAIGYKEFYPLVEKLKMKTEEFKISTELLDTLSADEKACYLECKEKLCVKTLQYARY